MVDIFVELISTVGFPIAVCIALFWYINSAMKNMTTSLEALKTTVENNTSVVTKLNERLDRLEDKSNAN